MLFVFSCFGKQIIFMIYFFLYQVFLWLAKHIVIVFGFFFFLVWLFLFQPTFPEEISSDGNFSFLLYLFCYFGILFLVIILINNNVLLF